MYDDYKKKQAQIMKKQRTKKKNEVKEMALVAPKKYKDYIDTKRQNERERSKRYRQRKKMLIEEQRKKNANENSFVTKSYSSSAALGKAKKRVKRALPESPTKKKAVLVSIFKEMDDGERNELVKMISLKPSTITLNASTKYDEIAKAIAAFYERDDISRVSPKMKDVQKRKSAATGADELTAKRHMVMTLKEAYALFVEDRNATNKGIKIKMSVCKCVLNCNLIVLIVNVK